MVVSAKSLVTVEEFEAFSQQPGLGDARYEFIRGEIVEVVSNNYASRVAGLFLFFIQLHTRQHKIGGSVTGADGGYIIAGDRYIPDVAFISQQRQPDVFRGIWNPLAPDLAVEVVSDETSNEELRSLRRKITNYLAVGTVVWAVFPVSQLVEIHAPGQPVLVLRIDDTLDGGSVLPGFQLLLREVFG